MQVNNINNVLNFKSGLNQKILQNCLSTKGSEVEVFLKENKNIKSDFRSCDTLAFLTENAIKILDIFKSKTGAKLFDYKVPGIYTYTQKELLFDFNGINFCVPETQKILKNNKKFMTGSLFFEKNDNLELLNYKLDRSFANNERSSSHYLSPFIHEFMHNVYLKFLYIKHGYEGICKYTKQQYFSKEKQNNGLEVLKKLQSLTFSDDENKIIESTVGKYATGKQNQYHELFAETFTKLICDSLAENGVPKKNPIELLKQLNPRFIIILEKIFQV